MVVLILVILGLCFGSFVNALVWRLHEQAKSKKAREQRQLSILRGRSMCPDCKHELGVNDLIPVVSWLWLRGKCRYCHQPISWQYPLVEASMALLFIVSYWLWPLPLRTGGEAGLFGLWLLILIGLIALLVYDLRWMLLPNRLVYPLVGLAAITVTYRLIVLHGRTEVLLGALWGVLCLSGLFYVLFQLSNGRWIGGGDVKLGLVLGLLVGGPSMALLLLFLASLMGSLVSAPLLLTKRLKPTSRLPFGPFLIVSAIIVQLVGATVISWYKRTFLIL